MVKYETWVHALLANRAPPNHRIQDHVELTPSRDEERQVAVGAFVLCWSLCGMVDATDAGVSAGHFGTAFIARLC